MKYDEYGQLYCTTKEIVDLIYKNPDLDIEGLIVEDADDYNRAVKLLHADLPKLKKYTDLYSDRDPFASIEEFDNKNQSNWFMPKDYYNLDIEKWCLGQCSTQDQTSRVTLEFNLYRERNLIRLLQYLKFLVDTLRANNIVWGVGRGSSVASYVLYLIGVHRIDSLQYDLDITEFLK